MARKELIRKKYLLKRKKYFFEIDKSFFKPLINLIKYKNCKTLALFSPTSYELNVLSFLNLKFSKKITTFLPVIKKNFLMNFYEWKKTDVLKVNKHGILEPLKSKPFTPGIILVPLIAYDLSKNRLGYGKGYYDRFLNKCAKKNNRIISVGVAFSFQKYHNLPVNKNDVKLDYIITEKGIF